MKVSDAVAESLVPYYRQILPVMNLLKHRDSKYWFILKLYESIKNKIVVNIGDKIDYGQKKCDNVGELI